jgi:heme exporter protein C
MTSSPVPAMSSGVESPDRLASVDRPVVDWVMLTAVFAVAAVYVTAIRFTPIELRQGIVQKIFYLHVPAAIAAYLAFGIMALMSLIYLWIRDARADRLAEASAEVAVMFFTVVLVSGPIWAHSAWNTYWTWEPRLTSALFVWFLGVGYLVMRRVIDEVAMRARFAAVLGVLQMLLIVFVHLSVYLYPGLHPPPMVLAPPNTDPNADPVMSPEMLRTYLTSMAVFAGFCLVLVRARYRLAMQRETIAVLEERHGQ